MMTMAERDKRLRELTNAVIRAARDMRDATATNGNVPGWKYGEPWKALIDALTQRDDFAVRTIDDFVAPTGTSADTDGKHECKGQDDCG